MRYLEVAKSSIFQALYMVNSNKNSNNGNLSFFTGLSGIISIAAYIGLHSNDAKLVIKSKEIFINQFKKIETSEDHDILNGNAGVILGLLILSEIFNDNRCLKTIVCDKL